MSKDAPALYLFVSNRNIVVRSVHGAAVGFEKGKPTHVPRHLHTVVMEKGILPCDKDGKVLDVDEAPATREDDTIKVLIAPPDPISRQKAVILAIEAILGRNDANDFTSGGTPHERAVTAALGWRVDQKEVKTAFQKMRSKDD